MDKSKNYYQILGVTHLDELSVIKKAYYKLSFKHHPDKNGDAELFAEITEAYDVFFDEKLRTEYDNKSRYGKNFNESHNFFDVGFDLSYDDGKEKLEQFKKFKVNNIQIEVDDKFDGNIKYERWVICKTCDGTGKDLSAKIILRDVDGNITKTFDADDGCDFCEGTGESYDKSPCSFCQGHGKIGMTPCKKCEGEGRIMGSQRLKNIKLDGDETKLDAMGHYSKNGVGYLLIVKEYKDEV